MIERHAAQRRGHAARSSAACSRRMRGAAPAIGIGLVFGFFIIAVRQQLLRHARRPARRVDVPQERPPPPRRAAAEFTPPIVPAADLTPPPPPTTAAAAADSERAECTYRLCHRAAADNSRAHGPRLATRRSFGSRRAPVQPDAGSAGSTSGAARTGARSTRCPPALARREDAVCSSPATSVSARPRCAAR